MLFDKSTSGVMRASAKVKGAFGVKHMIDAVAAALSNDDCFNQSAELTIDTVRAVAARWEATRPSSSMSGFYTLQKIKERTLCYGTVLLDLGNDYVFGLHWELLSGDYRQALETMLYKNESPLEAEPQIVGISDATDCSVGIWTTIQTLLDYLGQVDHGEELLELS